MLNPERTAYWESWVQGIDPDQIQQAQVRTPAGEWIDIPPAGTGVYLTSDFASEAERALAFPDGDYQLNLTRTDGSAVQVGMAQTAASYPSVPGLDPFQFLQLLAPGVDLELRIQPAADALESDFIVVSLDDGAGGLPFTTPWPGQAGALNGRSDRVRIPGAILKPQQAFMVHVTAYRPKTMETLPNGAGIKAIGVCSTVMTTLTVGAARAAFVPKQRPVVKHSFDAFAPATAELSSIVWKFRDKEGRIRPVYEKGSLGAVSLSLTGLNWPEKSDSCGRNVPAWGDPTETRIACQFDAVDPVPKMQVRDAEGVWREAPCTTWWTEFKLAHAFELLVFNDETGARREVIKPREGKWKYEGGKTFATADYTGTPDLAQMVSDGTITEETLIKLYHAPK